MSSSVSHLEAIGLAVAGFTLWVLADTTIKLAGQSALPAYEVIAFQGFFIAAFLALYGFWRRDTKALWPTLPKRQFLRSCLDLGNNLCVVVALRHLPLTMFYILVFTAPMVIAILGVLFLREDVEWRKGCAIFAGFAGVVIAVNPFGSHGKGDWFGYAACAVCVACFSTNMVWSRRLTQIERPDSLTFFSGLVGFAAGLSLMLWHAEPVSLRMLALLSAMGMFCALGSICFFTALKFTTAADVSQYHYTQLLSGSLLTWLIWREKPTIFMLMGGVLITVAGIYIAVRAARQGIGPKTIMRE